MTDLTSRQNEQQNQLLKLFADPFQGQIQINAFWASFGVSIGISAALALLFSLLRPRHNLVYAPKAKYADAKHAPPPIGRGPFSWIKPVAKTKEQVLVDRIGLDAAIFLRFTRMLRNIFCILGIIGIAVMIPVNVTMADKAIVDKSNSFAVMTPLYVFGSGLWAQVVMAYFIDAIVIYFLWYNYKKVFHLRRAYYESPEYQKSLHARSVLLRHIPPNLRNEAGVLQLVDEVNPTGVLPLAITARNVRDLPELIEKHEEAVRKLESILAKYLKNPERIPARKPMMTPPKGYNVPTTGGKVDAIEFWRHRISVLEQTIADTRNNMDSHDALPYGFAAWNQVQQAHAVAYAARKKSPQGVKIRPAPRPSDLIWPNLGLSKSQLRRKSIMNFVWVTVLTIVWTPLNAGLAIFVSNLSNLGSVWTAFQRQLEAHKVFWSIVQGIAAPAITSLVYLVLPIIFRRLQIRAGDVTKTARELHVLRNLYLFFVLNNLVVYSLFAAVWQFVTNVINESKSDNNVWNAIRGGQFFLTVTTQLCQAISPFWVTWILQRNLGAAIDLAQLWTLFYQWFAKVFLAPTPRQHIEWTAPQPFQYASYYNYFLFYATVSLCFATLQPIVLVCTALYFIMDAVLKKYLLMYVFVTKTESGGQFWRTLINRLLFACLLANVVIGVTVKARGTWVMVGCLVPLLFIVLGFKWYCMKTFDPGMDYFQQSGMHDVERPLESAKAISQATGKFRHPALEKKLITPMVSSKAKHIVQQIYSGRMDSDFDQHGQIPLQEIPVQPMKQAGQSTPRLPFEVVPEAQQDFQFYQNRAEFREAVGDGLNKPEDLIGSRPGTPASLLAGPPRSASPYQDLPQKSSSPFSSPLASPKRKELATGQIYPANRSSGLYRHVQQTDMNDEGDISLNMQHGRYTDPHDDRANLLHDVGDSREPTGDFLSMDQWRTNDSTPQSRGDDMGGYDYFRGYRKS